MRDREVLMFRNRKFFALFVLLIVFSMLFCIQAAAYREDGAGNATETRGTNESVDVKGDYIYLFSYGNVAKDNIIKGKIGGDLIATSNSIKVEAEVGGNIRAAAQSLEITDSTAKNVTVAAYMLKVGGNTEFDAVYAAGSKVIYEGSCEYLEIWADEVYIYGKVTNGVFIHADKVFFSDTCEIDRATVEGASTPNVFSNDDTKTAKKYTENADFASKVSYEKTDSEFIKRVSGLLYELPAAIILMLFICLIAGKHLDEANNTLRYSTGSLIGFGIAGTIGIPMIALMLLIFPYTQMVSLALMAFYILFAIIASAFTSASIARMIFPNLNKILSSLIGVTVVTVASIIPSVSLLFGLFSITYILGYLLCRIFVKKEQIPML